MSDTLNQDELRNLVEAPVGVDIGVPSARIEQPDFTGKREPIQKQESETKKLEAREVAANAHSEIIDAFNSAGYPLNYTLVDMLAEGQEHQGGRRGSGFTQASRFLADRVFSPRGPNNIGPLDDSVKFRIEDELDDLYHEIGDEAFEQRDTSYVARLDKDKIQSIPTSLVNDESKMIAQMMVDAIYQAESDPHIVDLPQTRERMKIGTCTTAEIYFLDYVGRQEYLNRNEGKRVNIITNQSGEPVMLEKIGMGEDHSALTLVPTNINGVLLPPGSLIAVDYPKDLDVKDDEDGKLIPLDRCTGFQFLRLSTLAVAPEIRERAFGSHLEFQEANSMEGARTARIEDFQVKARERLVRSELSSVAK